MQLNCKWMFIRKWRSREVLPSNAVASSSLQTSSGALVRFRLHKFIRTLLNGIALRNWFILRASKITPLAGRSVS
jgi:hypothetical protein